MQTFTSIMFLVTAAALAIDSDSTCFFGNYVLQKQRLSLCLTSGDVQYAQALAPSPPPVSPPPPPSPVVTPVPFVQAPGPPGCRTVEQILAANPNLTGWLANLQVAAAPLPSL